MKIYVLNHLWDRLTGAECNARVFRDPTVLKMAIRTLLTPENGERTVDLEAPGVWESILSGQEICKYVSYEGSGWYLAQEDPPDEADSDGYIFVGVHDV